MSNTSKALIIVWIVVAALAVELTLAMFGFVRIGNVAMTVAMTFTFAGMLGMALAGARAGSCALIGAFYTTVFGFEIGIWALAGALALAVIGALVTKDKSKSIGEA